MGLYNPATIPAPVSTAGTNDICRTVAVPADIAVAQVLSEANPNRRGTVIWNNSDGAILLQYGQAPTATSFIARLNTNGYYEVPHEFRGCQIQGLWTATGGAGVSLAEVY